METNNSVTGQENSTVDTGMEKVQGSPKGKEEKLFTQEEVNGFVQSRLSRYKSQAEKEAREGYDQKLQELHDREMRILIKEQLQSREMPGELADVITCTDENDLKSKLDTLQRIYGGKTAGDKKITGFVLGAPSNGKPLSAPDPVREAMGLNRKG